MKQQCLFEVHTDGYGHTNFSTPATLARPSHPQTSRDAAAQMIETGRLAEHERVALSLVRLHPGMTGGELDEIAGAKKREVSKRLAGLTEKKQIRRGDKHEVRVCEVGGNNCATWWPL